MRHGFRCRCCGEWHHELPMAYGSEAPSLWYEVPERDRELRTVLSSDQCVIDDEYFFLRGNIEIPVLDTAEFFAWGVWVSLSAPRFKRAQELWKATGRESEPPYFGWLSTILPLYPNTGNLKTMVHTRPVGQRPFIELEPTDHPLAIEQRTGITLKRVQEIAEALEHRTPGSLTESAARAPD